MNTEKIDGFQRSMPYPIAVLWKKYAKLPEHDVGARHLVLCDVFESILKFIAIVTLLDSPPSIRKKSFPEGLDFLKRPSLGHWLSVIRTITRESRSPGDASSTQGISTERNPIWVQDIAEWFSGGRLPKDLSRSLEALKEVNFPRGAGAVEGILSMLVTYRNKVWKGHGAQKRDPSDMIQRISVIEQLLAILLESSGFMETMTLFVVDQTVITQSTAKYRAEAKILRGADWSAGTFSWHQEFKTGDVYLTDRTDMDLTSPPLNLSPLVEWRAVRNGTERFFFLNDVMRSKIEYLSYVEGDFYYHKEVRQELTALFSLDMVQSDVEADIVYRFSEEDRHEKSLHYYHKGREAAAQGNLEQAIVAYEDALEWYRSPDTLVALSRAMIALGDDPELIRRRLEVALELDPNHSEAATLAAQTTEEWSIEPTQSPEVNTSDYYTYYDLITPSRFHGMSIQLHAGIVLLLNLGVFVSVILSDNSYHPFLRWFPIVCVAQTVIPMLFIGLCRQRFINAYFRLLGQLKNTRSDTFEKFFHKQYTLIFGHFREKKHPNEYGWKLCPRGRGEGIFLGFTIIGSIIFSVVVLVTQEPVMKLPVTATILRIPHNAYYFIFLAVSFRYLIMMALFIREYSRKDLSPVLSPRSRTDGFSAMADLYVDALIMLTLFWVPNLMATSISGVDPNYTDVFAIGFGYLLVAVSLVAIGVNMKLALEASRSLPARDYANHMKMAYYAFTKHPDEQRLARLEWLWEHESKVVNVSKRLFSSGQWVIILAVNILLLGSTIAYVYFRIIENASILG